MLDTQNYKKDKRFWVKRISHNADALPELLWEEGEQSNELKLRKQNKKHLELLRFKISGTIYILFSFEEDSHDPFKLDQIHDYFWIKKRHSNQPCTVSERIVS